MKHINLNKLRYTYWLSPEGHEMVVSSDKDHGVFMVVVSSMSPTQAPPMAVFKKAFAHGGFNPKIGLKGWLVTQLKSKAEVEKLCQCILARDNWSIPYYRASFVITPPETANHFCQFVGRLATA